MAENRPGGRQRNVSGQGKDVYKRGSGTGTGPVGNSGGYSGRPSGGSHKNSGNSGNGGGERGLDISSLLSGKGKIIAIIIVIVLLIAGGGKGISSIFSGLTGGGSGISSILSGYLQNFTPSAVSTGWTGSENTGKLNKQVAEGAREKYTKIKGSGKDTVTIMVYMCGTDLESKSGMASADLAEMAVAKLSDKVSVIVYTGGCTGWKTSAISNKTNQIYRITEGGMVCLEKDAGNKSMTSPDTLSSFIQWTSNNYPADRYELIFWDHGGGSLSGYGYDQRFTSSGSMTIAGINTALKNGKIKFDFIGFDACLMATAENALMLSQYADYLIASEETEPGVGWYYTNWLTNFCSNTSMSTLDLGKQIIDDYTERCAQTVSSAKTTLSLVDLAELSATVPEGLKEFATSTTELIQSDSYAQVSDARSDAREFSSSSKIDQVDLVDLATNMGTDEGKTLADIILSAVKYNRTSSQMTNSYGLSIYFPYRKVSNVDNAVATYDAIGMDDEYAECIKQFAGMEVAGQAVSGGSTSSPLSSLLGNATSQGASSSSLSSVTSLLSGLTGGSSGISIGGIDLSSLSFLSGLDIGKASKFISENTFDASQLVWKSREGVKRMQFTEDQWMMIKDIELNLFIDDGTGYIDMGLDNIFEIDDETGELIGEYDDAWIAINSQPVAYYHTDTVDTGSSYTITGRVPVLINGEMANLIIVFDNAHPDGIVSAIRYEYKDSETETEAKDAPLDSLNDGDKIDFLCDYYKYDGTYQDSYMLGDSMTYSASEGLKVSDVYLSNPDAASAVYRITDIYGQTYWTPEMNG